MKTRFFSLPYSDATINYCIENLKLGYVGIFPTDTVYGIGCDCLNIQALQNLYSIKNRKQDKPINILVSNIDMVDNFVKTIHPIEKKLIDLFWPGPLTIIFDKSNSVLDALTSGLDTIGIRMPNNSACLELIDKFGAPIATSSANISDKNPATSINDKLITDFNNKVSFIIDGGPSKICVPSTIVRVENNEIKILRKGSITKSDIEKCFGGNINVR